MGLAPFSLILSRGAAFRPPPVVSVVDRVLSLLLVFALLRVCVLASLLFCRGFMTEFNSALRPLTG